jgi:hypothetical protein
MVYLPVEDEPIKYIIIRPADAVVVLGIINLLLLFHHLHLFADY